MSKEKCIIIASTLKPVDDIRSYRKIGLSLGKTNNYAVKIIGSGTEKNSAHRKVILLPLGPFGRLSLKRLLVPWRIFRLLLQHHPDLVIVSTHELLLPATLLKLLRPRLAMIYDIRENYKTNLLSQRVYSGPVKWVLAHWIRFKEKQFRLFFSHFFLAEKAYAEELDFLPPDRYTVVENKSLYGVGSQTQNRSGRQIRNLVFTGNLSENSGVLQAIHVFNQLKKSLPGSQLRIAGHAPSGHFLEMLQEAVNQHPGVTLTGGKEPVPYSVIREHLDTADLALVTYQLNASNRDCIPTKVYEYLAAGLPYLCQPGTTWSKFPGTAARVFATSLREPDTTALVNWYENIPDTYDPQPFTWAEEAEKITKVVAQLLH